jgi:hypothetical protein
MSDLRYSDRHFLIINVGLIGLQSQVLVSPLEILNFDVFIDNFSPNIIPANKLKGRDEQDV